MSEDELWQSYFMDNTDVLKNKLGITNKEQLQKAEVDSTLKKLTYLYVKPLTGKFDSKRLRQIHKILFEDIYPFAGEYRKVNMSKNLDNFVDKDDIEIRLSTLLEFMNEKIKYISSPGEYAYFLAGAYYEMIMIHPFREGNGRTVREFFREFIEQKSKEYNHNYILDMTKFDTEKLLLGVKERFIYPSLLESEFSKAIIPIEQVSKMR